MSKSPWKELQPSPDSNHSTTLRVDEEHPWDLFWAVGLEGNPQLACRLPADTVRPSTDDIPKTRAIEVRLAHVDDWCWFVIELQDRSFEDIFLSLCLALIESTRVVQHVSGITPVLLRHLARWQRMLGKAGNLRGLSKEEIIGLVGELLFLQEYLFPIFSAREALSFWVAPQDHPQDFTIPQGKTIEVKCRQATAPDMVHISSQWQLYQPDLPLYLVVLTLSQSNHGEGFSLHSLVQSMRGLLELDIKALDGFEEALLLRGYLDNPSEYDRIWWSLAASRCHLVDDAFPRLIPTSLPQGVLEVGYTLSLPVCEAWLVEMKTLFE